MKSEYVMLGAIVCRRTAVERIEFVPGRARVIVHLCEPNGVSALTRQPKFKRSRHPMQFRNDDIMREVYLKFMMTIAGDDVMYVDSPPSKRVQKPALAAPLPRVEDADADDDEIDTDVDDSRRWCRFW